MAQIGLYVESHQEQRTKQIVDETIHTYDHLVECGYAGWIYFIFCYKEILMIGTITYTRQLRQNLIDLDNKKRKLVEDKNKQAVKLIEIEYNKLLGVYIEHSKQTLKKKCKEFKM